MGKIMCRAKQIIDLHRSGMHECQTGNCDVALEKLRLALDETRKIGLECYQVKILNNLGIIFELKGDNIQAKEHYQQAHVMAVKKVGHEARISRIVEGNLARLPVN